MEVVRVRMNSRRDTVGPSPEILKGTYGPVSAQEWCFAKGVCDCNTAARDAHSLTPPIPRQRLAVQPRTRAIKGKTEV